MVAGSSVKPTIEPACNSAEVLVLLARILGGCEAFTHL
jgi:hypothetical protein